MNYEERRSFYRMQLNWHVDITELDSKKHYQAQGRNLSAQGISFFSAENCPAVGSLLRARVVPDKTLVSPLDAEVEVLRVEQEGNGYLIAARICRMLA